MIKEISVQDEISDETHGFPGATLADSDKQSFREVGEDIRKNSQLIAIPRVYRAESDGRMIMRIKRASRPWKSARADTRNFSEALPLERLWDLVRDQHTTLTMRTRVLAELISRSDVGVAEFTIEELDRAENNPPWRNELIFAIEHLDFRDAELRKRVSGILLTYAARLRDSANPNSIAALWAALRVYSAIIPEQDANSLVAFLSHEYDMGTRQVALQCIQRIFLSHPPTDASLRESLNPLVNRVSELTAKYLDPDWLSPGDNSSLAINAFYAAASLGDSQLAVFADRIVKFQIFRLTRMARRFISELMNSWINSDIDYRHNLIDLLRKSLAILSESQ